MGALGGLGAIPGWGWAAMGAAALLGSGVLDGGETRHGGVYRDLGFVHGPSGGEIQGDAVRRAIQGTTDATNYALKTLGSSATVSTLHSGLESSENGKGFAYAGMQLSDGTEVGQGLYGGGHNNRRGSKSQDQAFAEFSEELKQVTLQALQASDVKGQLADYIRSLGDIDALTGGSLDAAYNRVQKALQERATLEQRLRDMTTSSVQKLTEARQKELQAVDSTNRGLLNRIYHLQDLQTAVGTSMSSLQASVQAERVRLQSAHGAQAAGSRATIGRISSSVGGLSDLSSLLSGTISQYRTDATSGMGRQAAMAQLQTALAIAKAGGPALKADSLRDPLSVISESSTAGFGSLADFIRSRDAERQTIADLAGITDAELSLQEQQLKALQDQQLQADAALAQEMTRLDGLLTSAQAQVDAVMGTTVAVYSVEEAVDRMNSALQTLAYGLKAHGPDVPGFASGGDFAGGVRLVGERGPEIELTGPSRYFSASQTRDILAGGGSGAAQEAAMLRAEVSRLREDMRTLIRHTFLSRQAVEELRDKGVYVLPSPGGETVSVEVA
jgi:hypothetical protein